MKNHPYIVVDRPGYYGRTGKVRSAHRTRTAAIRAAKRHRYVDEHGEQRSPVLVAINNGNRYRAGDTFYSDMAPEEA